MFKGMTRMDGGHSCLISDLVASVGASEESCVAEPESRIKESNTDNISLLFIKKKHRKATPHSKKLLLPFPFGKKKRRRKNATV